MKVCFLDFDGVLNTHIRNFTDRELFSPAACKNLKSLLKKVPELKIVVSSAWRIKGLNSVKRILEKNGIEKKKVIDITGQESGQRGNQIQCWLNRNPEVTNIVIIDDDSDMEHLIDKLVQTNGFVGLTSKDVTLALKVLKEKL